MPELPDHLRCEVISGKLLEHRKKTVTGDGEIMPQYLVAIHHTNNYDPSVEGERRNASRLLLK